MKCGTKRLLLGAVAAVAVIFGFLAEERIRGVVALRRWHAEMRSKGENLTMAEIVPPAPTNSSRRQLSPEEAALWLSALRSRPAPPPAMRYVAPGRAQAMWQPDSWTFDRGRSNNWAAVAVTLQPVMTAIERFRADLTSHDFVAELDHDRRFASALPYGLPQALGAVRTLEWGTQLALHQQRLDLATKTLVAMATLVGPCGGERLLTNAFVRNEIAGISMSALWPALQANGWSDQDLASIQAAWEKVDFIRGMVRALEAERAMGSPLYDRRRYSLRELADYHAAWVAEPRVPDHEDLTEHLGWFGALLNSLVEAGARHRRLAVLGIWRAAWVEQDELRYLQLLQESLDRMRRTASEKRSRGEPQRADHGIPGLGDGAPAAWTGWHRIRYWVSMSEIPWLGWSPEEAALAEAQRDLAVTALAIKRYQLRHGGLPDRLEALTPEFVATVPRDWFADLPLHYQTKPDGSFLLYSVGPDGEDNGGDVLPTASDAGPSFTSARDLVWPHRASAEEVATFESALRGASRLKFKRDGEVH